MFRNYFQNLSPSQWHRYKLLIIFLASVALFSILALLVTRQPGTDDFVFQEMIKPYPTLQSWIDYRYHTWSGRIFPESFVYLLSSAPLLIWKLISIAFYAVATLMLFLYYRLFTANAPRTKDYFMLILAAILPYMMHVDVLFEGAFWVTGAVNYAWIITFALVGMYPIAYIARHHRMPHVLISIFGIFSLFVAAISQEQVGASTVGLTLLLSVTTLWSLRHHTLRATPSIYLIASTLLSTGALALGVTAPGNKIRTTAEAVRWLPDFYTQPLIQHIEYSYRWILEAYVNHASLLLAGSMIICAILLLTKNRKLSLLDKAIGITLAAGGLLLLAKGHKGLAIWFNFHATWGYAADNISAYLALIPWLILIPITVFAPIYILRSKRGMVISILIAASVAATAIITLSPTMYASGWRTMFIPSILLLMAVYILFDHLIDKMPKDKIIFGAVLVISSTQYTYMLFKLIEPHL